MISKEYLITAAEGIHARPAAALIRLVKTFQSRVFLKSEEKTVVLNSMLNVLGLGARGGQVITILIEGPDEAPAAEAIDIFFREELHKL